jgi:hypothetical protein
MTSTDEVSRFIHLWTYVWQVQLTTHPNSISWRFTANGRYNVHFAYGVRLQGSFGYHDWKNVWTAKVENKCCFF